MRLIHYSAEPLLAVHSVGQGATRLGRDPIVHKPNGLWLSVLGEDDWPSFCRYNWRGWFDEVKYATEVVLKPDANLLVVNTEEEVLALNQRYPRRTGDALENYFKAPRWEAIAAEYAGIVIAPYQWGARLNYAAAWYYSWDCASACIWNADIVAELLPAVLPDLDSEEVAS